MFDIIDINFICVEYKDFYDDVYKNIKIFIKNNRNILTYSNNYNIRYGLNPTSNLKNTWIEIYGINKDELETQNFQIKLPKNNYFIYTYYDLEPSKSIVVFTNYNYFPFIFMGLPNLKMPLGIKITCEITSLLSSLSLLSFEEQNAILKMLGLGFITNSSDLEDLIVSEITQTVYLYNNYEGNYNYTFNTLVFRGWIYKIAIYAGSIIDIDGSSDYELFQIPNEFYLNSNTNIYFYSNSDLYSYVLYLNNYNFVDYKTWTESYDSIILVIEYYDAELDLNLDPPTVYSCAVEINLQTFNSSILDTDSGYTQKYYNGMFFKNYTNIAYKVKSITMFDYDYDKYFVNNDIVPVYNNIGSSYSNLYDKIIATDINLETPLIIDIKWWRINFDYLNLSKIINPYSENNYFSKFTHSKKITLDIIVDYLSRFELITYNLFKINNTRIKNQQLHNPNITSKINIQNMNLLNYNYGYDDKQVYTNTNKKYDIMNINSMIDFNNNIMNSIRCKIIFEYGYSLSYSFDAKLYLNNYNIRVYHKKYELGTNPDTNFDEDKKNLLTMLLFMATVPNRMKIIFYNTLESQPTVNSKFNSYLVPNPFYLFNQINLFKPSKQYDTFIEAESKNNFYTNQYLRLNININTHYYILFLYTEKNAFINYDELVFSYSQYLFKIFKIKSDIDNPNGNTDENTDLFFIAFQNLTELNIFMNYIEYGIFNTRPNTLSNYFNFLEGVVFCNYYNINNYWVLDSLPPPAIPYNPPTSGEKIRISFSINNMESNQIYLYGNLRINIII